MASTLPQAIADALARGATLLTPTQRASRAIRHAHNLQQQAAGQTLWQSASVLPLESWLAAQWHQRLLAGVETRILLNRTQEHSLWREIIQADPETPRLRSADSLADLAARAWSLLNLYNARNRLREFSPSTDSKAFDRWSRAFERRLQRAQLITPSELPAALAANPQPANLALIDFDTLPPALAQLMDTLEAQRIQTANPSTEILEHTAEDDLSELESAASWVHQHLDRNPEALIAVVVPNLADRRAAIERVFGPMLAPESLPITSPAHAPVYEFSLGRPLAELPLIATALDLLAWTLSPLPIDRIGALLLSPFLTPSANTAAAEFDAHELRQLSLLRPELTLDRTLDLLWKTGRREALAPLRDNLHNLQKAARTTQFTAQENRQTYAAWADAIATLLDVAGWTAQAQRTSLTFQQHRRFESALDELAMLDALTTDQLPAASEALATLTRLLRQTIFAPESQNAPVQILGPLELGGIPFDALWFLSADDLTWPAPPAPNPLLPWQLQRALGMPGADRTRDDTLAQSLTTRIAHSARTAVFSFARHSAEGDRRPSPLLASLSDLSETLPALGVLPLPLPLLQTLETIPDNVALPPLPPGTTGGSHILQLQAACPFRAFAETRLRSTQPETRAIGLNPMERGSLVHHVMQTFWTDVRSQSNLRNLSPTDRATTLAHAVGAALAAATPQSPWDEAYLALERQRLFNLLNPWLDLELLRTDFHVEEPEQRKQFQLGPLTFSLRIDRIDATAHGDLILDYKTGRADPKDWQGDRPDAPQLPLYAILAQQENRAVGGIAFAQLRPGQGLTLSGISDDPGILTPGKAKSMPAASVSEQIAQWHETLTNLATDYFTGVTRVDPKLYPKTCEYCTQRILCRLNPDTLSPSQTDDEEPTDA